MEQGCLGSHLLRMRVRTYLHLPRICLCNQHRVPSPEHGRGPDGSQKRSCAHFPAQPGCSSAAQSKSALMKRFKSSTLVRPGAEGGRRAEALQWQLALWHLAAAAGSWQLALALALALEASAAQQCCPPGTLSAHCLLQPCKRVSRAGAAAKLGGHVNSSGCCGGTSAPMLSTPPFRTRYFQQMYTKRLGALSFLRSWVPRWVEVRLLRAQHCSALPPPRGGRAAR